MEKLSLYNTLTKKVEEFVPNTPGKISMYICGPTVYDSAHIGHARTYISFDVIRRVLRDYFKFDVTLVMNITDIEDKIIARAAERQISCAELIGKYEDEFFAEMGKLGIERPSFVTRVTEYVAECISFIERLEENGYAYASNGSVYFDLAKYKAAFQYNLLRPKTVQEEAPEPSLEKRGREDFVLWKASKPNEPIYESRWGPGRPGWHIECSAMSTAVFGEKLDIHAGGIDLAFPHHENEVAQCQGHSEKHWVNYFLHTGHLNINGLKMSKSLKNFLTIADVLSITTPENMRILFLQHAWHKDMNYEPEQLREADAINRKLVNFMSNAEAVVKRGDKRALNPADLRALQLLNEAKDNVHSALSNNIDTPRVLELILELISTTNQSMRTLHSDALAGIYAFVVRIMGIFGIQRTAAKSEGREDELVALLSEYRAKVRDAAKLKEAPSVFFGLSDTLREDVKQFGFVIDDTREGSFVRKA
ncbi:cysteinyl-tRNA synthetase [Pancytospora philotis]|nr:cysteinyl-tRNA synthetase [Pancytospora philotis]